MKQIYLKCQKCHTYLETKKETERGLCSRCERSGVKRLRVRFKEEERSSSMDDFLDPLGLENFGE